jgi:hypothetical protein
MHPTLTSLAQEMIVARQTLSQPSQNDPIIRVLLAEIIHGQDMQNRVSKWLDTVGTRLEEIDRHMETLAAQASFPVPGAAPTETDAEEVIDGDGTSC